MPLTILSPPSTSTHPLPYFLLPQFPPYHPPPFPPSTTLPFPSVRLSPCLPFHTPTPSPPSTLSHPALPFPPLAPSPISTLPHLSYLGDAEIGDDTNIAAGNITANFKHELGLPKAKTRIGSNVRTGVDNTFDAPLEIGDDAWIAPGAVITDDVPPGSLAGFAPRQETKEGWVYERHGKHDR